MRVVRRHLRLGVTTWLVCHVLAFSALLPRDCCAAHSHAAHGHEAAPDAVDHSAHAGHAMPAEHEHHAAAAADATAAVPSGTQDHGAYCPMRGPDGAPCPMHAPGGDGDCRMVGVCNQPAAALAAVLMQAAVPPAVFALVPRSLEPGMAGVLHTQPLSLAHPPDSPPPRL